MRKIKMTSSELDSVRQSQALHLKESSKSMMDSAIPNETQMKTQKDILHLFQVN